ncbi:MAG: membrane protein insertase YidC [Pseudomonadales bacterium]|nr:membrane protein insertase YidC [Pseudomonadales bacterium]
MLPPEVMRVLLLIGMAATGYMMIQAWNEDYVKKPPAHYEDNPLVEGGGVVANEAVQGAAPQTSAASESDVPDASILESDIPAQTPGIDAAAPVAGQSRLVTVNTPTLKVWIDRLGGDVVRIQLPKYPISIDTPDAPYLLMENSGDHTYLAQSGLTGRDGVDKGANRPLYTVNRDHLEVAEGETGELELSVETADKRVVKRFVFPPEGYLIDVEHALENRSAMSMEAALFSQFKRDDKEPIVEEGFSFGPRSFLGGALTTSEERYVKISFDDLEDAAVQRTVAGGWMAFLQHYFVGAWIADPDETNTYYANRRNDGLYVFGYASPKKSVAPGDTVSWHARLYAGPKEQERLAGVAPNLNLTVDYGFLWWLASPLFDLLTWLEGIVGNWGVAIILLTLMVKIVLYPLFNISYKSMAKMRKVAPELKRLQERYADDRQKLSQEMMKLYQKEGANPLGGCLPMLLPMPVFLALYWVLWESVELRQAPFFGWIQDLSSMDPLFVLPLLMGVSMYLQQLMAPAMGDPMQQRMMRIMPVMFTVLFLFFPAGLVLYWLVNNVLSIAQQWYVTRQNA